MGHAFFEKYSADLCMVFNYVMGVFMDSVNGQLRAHQGKDVPANFKPQISIVASGLHALRSDPFSRKYTPSVVYRGEPDYSGAICESNGPNGLHVSFFYILI